MGLSDVAGVFSRYFVVGFFIPSFVVLVGVSQLEESLPTVYAEASAGGRIAIVGGASVVFGLVLLGLNHLILRLFEGYYLKWPIRSLFDKLQSAKHKRLDKPVESATKKIADATKRTDDAATKKAERERRNAVSRLARRFPPDIPSDDVLPTGFGNAIRAFERAPKIRWGFPGVAAWARIETLLSPGEKQLLADAEGNVAFFVNGSLLLAIAGVWLIAASDLPSWWLYLIPFGLSFFFYWASIDAAIGWGAAVNACIDVHRLELYQRIGLRTPSNFTDERENVAKGLSDSLTLGEPIDDSYAANPLVPTTTTESRR